MMPKEEENNASAVAKAKEATGEDSEIPDSHTYGYGPCRPDWCQIWCNRPSILLCAVCFFVFSHTFVINGIVNVNISTIERRYSLSTTQVAWIPATYDITAGVVAIISGYLGLLLHNGMMLTWAACSLGLGSFVMTMPHWIGDTYDEGQTPSRLCEIGGNGTDCSQAEGTTYMGLFLLAQVFHGIGGGILWVIAVPYIDSNIRVQNTSLYVGIVYMFASLGPACGYVFGGMLLSIYVDTGRVDMDDVTVEAGEPGWVGAWWIGYVISIGLMLCSALMMFPFPRELPSGLRYKKDRKSQAHKGVGDDVTKRADFGKSWKDVFYSLKIIFMNPIFVANTIAAIASGGIVTAFGIFLPKLMESQFSLTASAAGLVTGIVLVPGGCVGLFIGGCIPKVRKSKPRGLMVQSLISSLAGLALAFIYLIHCKSQSIAGVNVPYFASDTSMTLDEPDVYHSCNAPCNCTTDSYDPICGEYDQVQYFNPCLAGCKETWDDQHGTRFEDCSCVNMTDAPSISPNYTGWYYPDAWRGFCEEDCTAELALFLSLFLVQQLLVFMGMPSGGAITMRSIPDKERAFASGLSSSLIRFLGNVPAPLIFGAIFDSSCILWQESCDIQGSCWIYDSDGLAWGMFWASAIVSSICALCFIFGIIVYKPPPEEPADDMAPPGDEQRDPDAGGNKSRKTVALVTSTNGTVVTDMVETNGDVNATFDWNSRNDNDTAEITKL